MEYLILELDQNYIAPTLLEWYGILDRNTIERENHEYPKRMIFHVEKHMQMVFTDIITFPCLLLSGMVKDTILLYEPFIDFQRLILFCKERKKSEAYYIPNLPKVDCLLEGSILTPDKSVIKHAKVDTEKIGGRAIVQIGGVNRMYVLVCLDLAESILRRDTVGIGLRETECV